MELDTNKTLYSERAILASTFFCGPLAGAWFLRHNFLQLGDEEKAKNVIQYGIFTVLLILAIFYLLPDDILDRIPNILIPSIYYLITFLYVKKYQRETLRLHKENGGIFFRFKQIAPIAIIALIILSVCLLTVLYIKEANFDTDKYESNVYKFGYNDENIVSVYEDFFMNNREINLKHIDSFAIPLIHENCALAKELETIVGNGSGIFQKQAQQYIRFSKLRLEQMQLFRKSIIEGTHPETLEFKLITNDINALIEIIN